jgi:hydroxymethylglutaryl-CoA lyase
MNTDQITIFEEGPREGFQGETTVIPVADKIELIEALAATGLKEINCASFVSTTQVPQMADAEQIFERLQRRPQVQYSALWLNAKGFERAVASGVDLKPTVVTSASETFGLRNNRMDRSQLLESQRKLIAAYGEAGLSVATAYVFTAFGCNFEGETPASQVVSSVQDLLRLAEASGISFDALYLCDTVGSASPRSITTAVDAVRTRWPELTLALHLHDTRGLGIANAKAGLDLGIRRFDTSVAGLGGCPFSGSRSAAGNLCTEDFAYLCEQEGYATGIDLDQLIACGLMAERIVGRRLPGKIKDAGLFDMRRKSASA